MKKVKPLIYILFIFLSLIFFTREALANLSIGINYQPMIGHIFPKGELNFMEYHSTFMEFKPIGFTIPFEFYLEGNDGLAITTGISFLGMGGGYTREYQGNFYKSSITLYYLQFPLYIKYKFSFGFYLYGGFGFSFLTAGINSWSEGVFEFETVLREVYFFNLTAGGGLGYEYLFSNGIAIFIEFAAEYGFININDGATPGKLFLLSLNPKLGIRYFF